MTPADLARGLERDRRRILESQLVDPTPWTIARTLQQTLKGESGEGLRGLYDADTGQILWWPSYVATHSHARLILGEEIGADILEVEVNVDDAGTLYPCWSRLDDVDGRLSAAFLSHPAMQPLMDGSLTHRGRQIVLGLYSEPIRLVSEPAVEDRRQRLRDRRTRDYRMLATQAAVMTKTRRPHLEDGTPVPCRKSLKTWRYWLDAELEWPGWNPVPTMSFEQEKPILAHWRGTDQSIDLLFDKDTMTVTETRRGRVRKSVTDGLTTYRRVLMRMEILNLHLMRECPPAREDE